MLYPMAFTRARDLRSASEGQGVRPGRASSSAPMAIGAGRSQKTHLEHGVFPHRYRKPEFAAAQTRELPPGRASVPPVVAPLAHRLRLNAH